MGGIFNYDNPVFRAINKLTDIIIISVCWFFACIPIFTIGAANAALYSSTRVSIRKDKGYAFSGFWKAFKDNFKPATKACLIQLIVIIVLASDIYVTMDAAKLGKTWGSFFVVFWILLAFVTAWCEYTYAYVSRIEQTTKNTLKNAALIMIAKLPWTVLAIVLTAVGVVVFYLLPFLIVVLPAVICVFLELIFERIFRTLMTPEEVEKEKEDDLI